MELPVLAGLFLQSSDRFLGCVGIHWCLADAWKSEEAYREMVMFFRSGRFACKSYHNGDLLGVLDTH